MAYIFYNSKYTNKGLSILYYNTDTHTYQIWAGTRTGGVTLTFESKSRAKAVEFREGLT